MWKVLLVDDLGILPISDSYIVDLDTESDAGSVLVDQFSDISSYNNFRPKTMILTFLKLCVLIWVHVIF